MDATYTTDVNELYATVLEKCKALAASGSFRTHFTTQPVECTEETNVAVIHRLRKEQFAANTRFGFNGTDTVDVSWYNPCTGLCDAHSVQLLHPTMFKGFSEVDTTVEGTAQRLCDGVLEECNMARSNGELSYILNVSHVIKAELARGMDHSIAEQVEQRLAQLLNDKKFTAVGLCQRATKYLRINW